MCTIDDIPFATVVYRLYSAVGFHTLVPVIQAIKNHAGDLSSTGRELEEEKTSSLTLHSVALKRGSFSPKALQF
jgi:hypothetical protein